jgi:putative transposase
MTDMMSGVENAEDPKPGAELDGLTSNSSNKLVSRPKPGGLMMIGEGVWFSS